MGNENERESSNLDNLVSPERQNFYKHIQELLKNRLPKGEAELVVAAAMGSSIKDILLTVPLSDNSVIVLFDEGPFTSSKQINPVGEFNTEGARKAYRRNYSRESKGSNFFRSGDFGIYDLHGFGKDQLMKWELEDLGVDLDTVSITRINTSNTFNMTFEFNGSRVSLFFVEGMTNTFDSMPAEVKAFIEKKKIDVVVARGDDGAYKPPQFAGFLKDNMADGSLLVSDRTQTLKPHQLHDVELSTQLKADVKKGIAFGYPVDHTALYTMEDSVHLKISQKK